MLVERVARFLAGAGEDTFESLALAAFAFQFERVEPYRRLCRERGVAPGEIDDWRAVPAAPAALFRSQVLAAAPAREVFRGGGEAPSVHHHPFPDLGRAALDAAFPDACLSGLGRPPMLALVPPRKLAPDSVPAFVCEHVLGRWAGPGSEIAFARGGVEVVKARSWLAARQRDGRPCLVLAIAEALSRLLDALGRQGLRLRLPTASRLVAILAGAPDEGLAGRVAELLTLPPSAVVREYGRTELTSRLYSRALAGEDPELLVPPPWVRVRVLDPATLEEAPSGGTGLVAIFDLANLGSAAHVLTDDLGRAEGPGFRLVAGERGSGG